MPDGRRRLGFAVAFLVGLLLLSVYAFFETGDPMVLLFGILACLLLAAGYAVVRGLARHDSGIRLKCTSCAGLNLDGARFCSACGKAL